jgi:xylan 1,4-beta-xylosidase
MLGLLGGERVNATSSAALDIDQILRDGVRSSPDVPVIATRSQHGVQALVWNYHDDDLPASPASVEVTISGLPADRNRALLQHFRIDSDHSNAFTAWKETGSPQSPTSEQYKQLESAGQLQLLTSPEWIRIDGGIVHLKFELPRQGLSLLKIDW